MNRRLIHRLLAQIDSLFGDKFGLAFALRRIRVRRGQKAYEVEHIWADHPERHADEFPHPSDFEEFRNRIGGLLLLPKSSMPATAIYRTRMRRSPNRPNSHTTTRRTCWRAPFIRLLRTQPGFLRFIHESGLPFEAHPQFKKADIEKRAHSINCLRSVFGIRKSCGGRRMDDCRPEPVPRDERLRRALAGKGAGTLGNASVAECRRDACQQC